MSERIRSHKDLRVYQAAMDNAMDVFVLSKAFPPDERFGLTSQLRRSSRSVAANIAEAWRKRRYPQAFVAKLSDAEAEASETQTWIEFARRCGYLDVQTADHLDSAYEIIISQVVVMASSPENWKVSPTSTLSDSIKEDGIVYLAEVHNDAMFSPSPTLTFPHSIKEEGADYIVEEIDEATVSLSPPPPLPHSDAEVDNANR